MATVFAAIAVAASAIGLVYASVAPQCGPRAAKWKALASPELRLPWMISLGLTGVIFVIAAVLGRSSGSGMALAWGVLIGGAVAIIAFFESAGSFEEQDWCVRVAGLLSAGCLAPAVVLLVLRGHAHEALSGCGLAAAVWAVASSVILRPAFAAAPSELRIARSCYRGMEVFALATIAVIAGARLGIDHFPSPVAGAEEEAYWVVPVLLLAAEALMMVLATGGRDSGLPRWTAVMRGGEYTSDTMAFKALRRSRR